MRVLVVEDDALTRATIVKVLRERGHHVAECSAAEAGIALHRSMPFPLLILDWVLPGMDGLELCRRVRNLPGGDCPVIVIATSRSRPEDLMAGLDAGADDYLTKPLDQTALTTRLAIAERTVLERARRELTEEALLSSEESFRALIEGSPDGILAHRNGRIVYVNPRLLTLLKYESTQELVGRPFLDLIHPDDLDSAATRVREMLRSGDPSPAREVRLAAKDGTVATLEEVAIPLEFDGQPAVAAVFRDVAERKRMEEQLLMADRMVSVGTLAAGIAHEINNPLAYVVSNLRFIMEEVEQVAETLPSPQLSSLRELLAQADDGAERVRVIVRDLKSFSRADDTGEVTDSLHRVLDGAISLAWNEIRHRARLIKDYDTVPAVVGNEAKLGQVFLNLLVNAAQALPVGNANDHAITVRTQHREGHVLVQIEDTGIGIQDDVKHRVFDPFFTTKPVGQGVGLGLSICHNIINAVGGSISVDSAVDMGTCFNVVLPTVQAESAPAPPASMPPRHSVPAIGGRVLVIDDEPSVARALQRALRGHDVTIALSGREALSLLSGEDAFDLVFCDLMMAEVSGMELFAQVEGQYPQLAERFIFMTGGAFTDRAREFIANIHQPLLEKPFDIQQVQALVSKAVHKARREAGAA